MILKRKKRVIINVLIIIQKEMIKKIIERIVSESHKKIEENLQIIVEQQCETIRKVLLNAENDLLQKEASFKMELNDLSEKTILMTKEIQKIEMELLEHRKLENIENIETILKEQGVTHKIANEILWAHIFRDTIVNSKWLIDKTFSPGRWAMGYSELYVLYRVLDEFSPRNILEIGLGQSTRMIAQYANANKSVEHYVVESDERWIDFYKNKNQLSENSQIVKLDIQMSPYKEEAAVRTFHGFHENFSNKKFDFILVDAPLGSDMKTYSRVDILSIIPDSLAKTFVIVLDDSDRIGELNTAKEIERILKTNQIEFKRNFYRGNKDLCIWTSIDETFLCSM